MNEVELLSRYGTVEPMDPALIDATIDAIVRAPDRPASPHHPSSGRPRRRASRLVLLSASVAAAAALAAVTLLGADGSSSPRPAPQVAEPQGGVLTAYILDHSLAALETAGGYVERVVQQDPSGVRTSWRGPNQLLEEVPGQRATLWTSARPGVDTVLRVDYQRHLWSKSTFAVPSPPPGPIAGPPPPGAYLFSSKALTGPEPAAASIAALFRQPGIALIGTAPVDGTSTYELRIPALDARGQPVSGKGLTAWVDTRTYLPVRIARGLPTGPGWTQDFTWEPATPRALAVFHLNPPALFRQVTSQALQP